MGEPDCPAKVGSVSKDLPHVPEFISNLDGAQRPSRERWHSHVFPVREARSFETGFAHPDTVHRLTQAPRWDRVREFGRLDRNQVLVAILQKR